jgi:hypothetical protein
MVHGSGATALIIIGGSACRASPARGLDRRGRTVAASIRARISGALKGVHFPKKSLSRTSSMM